MESLVLRAREANRSVLAISQPTTVLYHSGEVLLALLRKSPRALGSWGGTASITHPNRFLRGETRCLALSAGSQPYLHFGPWTRRRDLEMVIRAEHVLFGWTDLAWTLARCKQVALGCTMTDSDCFSTAVQGRSAIPGHLRVDRATISAHSSYDETEPPRDPSTPWSGIYESMQPV